MKSEVSVSSIRTRCNVIVAATRLLLVPVATAALFAGDVHAQGGGGGRRPGADTTQTDSARAFTRPGVNLRGVLDCIGCVRNVNSMPLTAEDSAIQQVVQRLDFDSYKNLIKGLTQFGDREQGTDRNKAAIDWIEQQLQGWGYTTERVKYEYRPRVDSPPEPREQVFAT